jgi:signal transduction histidine kinase
MDATAEQLAKQLRASQALYEISQLLASTTDLEVTLQYIADAANQLIKTSVRTTLHLLDESGESLSSAAISGVDRPQILRPLNFRLGQGIAGIVLETGQSINVRDVLTDARFVPVTSGGLESPRFRSLLTAPVMTEGRRLGTLSVQSPEAQAFNDEDERLLAMLGAQAALAIQKARLYGELQAALEHEKTARAQLVQADKLAALGRIVASVAHELNNPLQAIQNALYLIQMEQQLTPQARADLETVLTEADRMAGLIARLRETYRPARSEEFQSVDLHELIEETGRLLQAHLRRNHIELETDLAQEGIEIYLIRDQVKQVILNVCLNAAEAMPEGGRLSLRTRLEPQDGLVCLEIANNGEPIDPAVLPFIFDPFVTTKEGGTGLGLAIVYDIVQRHGGRIDVTSLPESGTRFAIRLPYLQRYAADPLDGGGARRRSDG